MRRPTAHAGVRAAGGMTLVELLVAMVIGLVLLLAVTVAFRSVGTSLGELAKLNTQVESARVALTLLRRDLETAAYWAGHVPEFDNLTVAATPTDVPAARPAPCLAWSAANWNAAHQQAVLGVAAESWGGVPDGCAALLTGAVADSDVLAVRHAEACAQGEPGCAAAPAGSLLLAVNRCASVATPYVLGTNGHDVVQQRDCATAAPRYRYESALYYVRNWTTTAGDGVPALVRSVMGMSGGNPAMQAPEALVDGVQAFHVEWGLDTISRSGAVVAPAEAVNWLKDASGNYTHPTNRGDGMPDGADVSCTIAAPCTVDQMMQAVTATVHLLVRATEPTVGYRDTKQYTLGSLVLGPFNDGFKRHVYSTTVRLNNVSSRRETQ